MTKMSTGSALVEAAAKWDGQMKTQAFQYQAQSVRKHRACQSPAVAPDLGFREGGWHQGGLPKGGDAYPTLRAQGGIGRKQGAEVASAPLAISCSHPAAQSRACHAVLYAAPPQLEVPGGPEYHRMTCMFHTNQLLLSVCLQYARPRLHTMRAPGGTSQSPCPHVAYKRHQEIRSAYDRG